MPLTSPPTVEPLLAGIPYFQGLGEPTRVEIIRSAFLYEYDAGQLVLLEGEHTAGLYLVESGWLKVSKIAVHGREQILQLLGRGEVFNAIGVFTGQPNAATVTAMEPSKVWLIRRDVILRLLESHPQFARLVIQDLAGRVQHLITLVEDLSLRSVEARLARLLLENATGERVERQQWATQSEIAARLGTVPDVISRTLRKLADQGVISISRQEIRLVDRARLEFLARVEP
jgi:CRP-like cAMP-binding protein